MTDTPPPPVEGMKITPHGWGDPILSGAFMACVNHATGNPEMRAAFEKEAGCSLDRLVTRSPIEKMVDDSTGFSRDLVAKWFDWVATNVWGDDTDEEDVNND